MQTTQQQSALHFAATHLLALVQRAPSVDQQQRFDLRSPAAVRSSVSSPDPPSATPPPSRPEKSPRIQHHPQKPKKIKTRSPESSRKRVKKKNLRTFGLSGREGIRWGRALRGGRSGGGGPPRIDHLRLLCFAFSFPSPIGDFFFSCSRGTGRS